MSTFNDSFLKACRGETVKHKPVWYMRQAGRYQPEYREIRKKYSLFEICQNPEVCAQVTTLPVEQLNVDAAILFSDITIPFYGMGVKFEIKENVGPVTEHPIRTESDIKALKPFDPAEAIPYVGETVKLLKTQLNVPLIGFAGAPFTLASYLVEGGPSKRFLYTKSMMYGQPELWHMLMKHLTETVIRHSVYQVEHGASVIQVFDSWVGNLNIDDYRTFVLPYMKQIFDKLKSYNVPTIHFGVGTSHLLTDLQEAGADVTGLDWRTEFSHARRMLGKDAPVQGNLEPAVLLAPWKVIEEKARKIMEEAPKTGHIFNLGHGVLPPTPVENLRRLTEFVHGFDAKT